MNRDDWERHWGEFGDAAMRNPANQYRYAVITRMLGRLSSEARVLDIGCGQGYLIAEMQRRCPDPAFMGIDISTAGVERARRLVPTAMFEARDLLSPAEVLPDKRDWATHAICSEVLEHVDDPASLLRGALGYMSRGCQVVVTVPSGPMSEFDRYIGHRRHFSAPALRSVLGSSGLTVERVERAGFPFFNLYRLAVLARGKRLVEDLREGTDTAASRSGDVVLRMFEVLFRANLDASPFGWQLVARAVKL